MQTAALPPYLRSLWNIAPALLDIAEPQAARAFVSPLGLHLPRQQPPDVPAGLSAEAWREATAAHAAAHLVFSRQRFDPAGLGPIPQAILGALEDARVDWLASRELPGLRRLWLRFHALDAPSALPGFEELLRRLGRALLDPAHDDPHPWVAKGRHLFFADTDGQVLALCRPDALRQAATRLGHDIGQMRLSFNARTYQVAPGYRDDNSCLWLTDPKRTDSVHEIDAGPPPADAASAPAEAPPPPAQRHLYPEWDRHVPLLRPRWCAVLDAPAAAARPAGAMPPRRRARTPHTLQRRRRQPDGLAFDLDALVDAQVALRRGATPPAHVYLGQRASPTVGTMLVLIDSSASTARALADGSGSLLDAARRIAWDAAARWPRSAIHASCSDGRHAVHYARIKDFGQPLDEACWQRLSGLPSRLSTRLGTALRHATRLLADCRGGPRRLLLITDGRPQDVDVHDPRYLPEDARHAVTEARRCGVQAQCLGLDAATLQPLQRIFGAGQVQVLTHLGRLEAALSRLDAGRTAI